MLFKYPNKCSYKENLQNCMPMKINDFTIHILINNKFYLVLSLQCQKQNAKTVQNVPTSSFDESFPNFLYHDGLMSEELIATFF